MRSVLTRTASWLLISATALACSRGRVAPSAAPPARSAAAPARILFVGNSLTHANRLPAMVEALARSAGLEWDVRSVTTMGASLRDHLAGNIVRARLRDERWDFVVLQQGPSTLPESRAELRLGAAAFRELIEQAGARSALYMVWPDSAWSRSRFVEDFDRVRDSYALAAHDIGGLFVPAGEAWRSVRARDATLPLFGPDGFHPAPEGTYVAALAIFARLSKRPLAGLPGRLEAPDGSVLVNVPAERAAVIQEAVADALARFGDYRPADRP